MKTGRYHIIIDLQNIPDDKANDSNGLREFLNNFPAKIGMSVLNGPHVVKGIPENPGLTGVVLIDFSHISVHTFTKHNEALVDIFSCKPYAKEVALGEVLNYFQVSESSGRIQEVNWE